jgi:hypothetical protein
MGIFKCSNLLLSSHYPYITSWMQSPDVHQQMEYVEEHYFSAEYVHGESCLLHIIF